MNWNDFTVHIKKTSELTQLVESIEPKAYDIMNMTLPKETKLLVECTTYSRAIRLVNKFCKSTITGQQSYGRRGLGEWQWLLGYNESKSNQFWSSILAVNLHAEFEKLRS